MFLSLPKSHASILRNYFQNWEALLNVKLERIAGCVWQHSLLAVKFNNFISFRAE
jgi:hypothetical protein